MNKEQIYQAVEEESWPEADRRTIYNSQGKGVPRIMPEQYQADAYRRFNESILLFDNFLRPDLLERLRETCFVMAKKTKGWSKSFFVKNNQLDPAQEQVMENRMRPDERLALDYAIGQVTAEVHRRFNELTHDQVIVKYNTWINTGSIPDHGESLDKSFHFWHYDSDEYMEFCMRQDWIRFPVWGVILYINEPAGERHYTVFDDRRINQKIRSITNRLVIFEPSYMHKVIGTNRSDDTEDTRLVMVFNAWDYDVPDYTQYINHKYEQEEAES